MSHRLDRDSLGEIKVPSDVYYGPFTSRAINQYKITKQRPHIQLIKAYVMIKQAAALTNMQLKCLDHRIGNAIVVTCKEILSGKLLDQFVIEPINSGAGTAFNMNCNEVIANRALELLCKEKGQYDVINPNDHVNMSQSSNDTFPTAMNLAIIFNASQTIISIEKLMNSLNNKSFEFRKIAKIGRTHLMDAIPVTLGSEFNTYAYSLELAKNNLLTASKNLYNVGLGGTAVGTGANTPSDYQKTVLTYLSNISNLELKTSANLYYSLQSKYDVSHFSSCLRNLSLELIKIANDIRLMASGPTAGFAEIIIPAVHAGSSIMPGKVNPSLAESLNMVCFDIIGNDVSVAMAAQAGQFELNVMLPGMLKNILDSTDMIINFIPIFTTNLIDGIKPNFSKLRESIEKSPILVTLLNPYIGYLKAAELYKESLKSGKNIRELVLEKKLLTSKELDDIFSEDKILGI